MPSHFAILAANQLEPREMRWALMTLVTIVLLFLIFVLGLMLVRMMRHKRERLERKRPAPTEYVDVWSMHRVPEDSDAADNRESPNDDPDDNADPGDEERPTP